jgi:ankyrin repeat protein
MTALMYAAERGRVEAVQTLLEDGADRTIRDNTGRTAYDHAVEQEYPEVVAILQ